MSGYTVLILGAGASIAYGLPLGNELVKEISELLPSSNTDRGKSHQVLLDQLRKDSAITAEWDKHYSLNLVHALILFRQKLVGSEPKSIDAFLSGDFGPLTTVFRQIGKLAIAHVIAKRESLSIFQTIEESTAKDDSRPKDHWYRYLWQDCLKVGSQSLDDLKAKKLRVVSFNYDRSLEYFLGWKIAATFPTHAGKMLYPEKIQQWAADGFKEIETNFQVIHPYGNLGSLSEVPYGDKDNFERHGARIANKIRVIGEERDNSGDNFAIARNWIAEARFVVFLGFSYDTTNMERLGLKNGLARMTKRGSDTPRLTDVFPLTHGFERSERARLYSEYFSSHFDQTVEVVSDPKNDRTPMSELHQGISITQYLRRYGALTHL